MVCMKCKTKYNGNFCPRCGTPAPTQSPARKPARQTVTYQNRKPKGKKQDYLIPSLIVFAVFIVIIMISIITSGVNFQESPIAQSTRKDTPLTPPADEPEKISDSSYENQVTAGHYTVGLDLPAGTYTLTAKEGKGTVSSGGGLNSPMGKGSSLESGLTDVKLKKGYVLSVTNTLALSLKSKDAKKDFLSRRKPSVTEPIVLESGHFTAGADFPAGTYSIAAKGPTGSVTSSNVSSGGINEIMGVDSNDYSIQKFNHANLPQNTILIVSGTSIQLVPVTAD